MVLQIHDFPERPQAAGQLEVVRSDHHVAPDIVDALIALEPLVKAKMARRQPGVPSPGDQDTGEDDDP